MSERDATPVEAEADRKNVLSKEAIQPLKQGVLDVLVNEANSAPFREPVDWEGKLAPLNAVADLGLNDYPSIIKKPMDLQTLEANLMRHKYPFLEDFFADVQLIWANCKTYNLAGSEIYRMAEYMERTAKRQISKFKKQFGIDTQGANGTSAARKESKNKGRKKRHEDSAGVSSESCSDSEDFSDKNPSDEDDDDFSFGNDRGVPFEKRVEFSEMLRH